MPEAQLPALLQLASAALPIGGFSYSSGLEAAVELGLVHDRASAERWIEVQLQCWARGEASIWPALHAAWQQYDEPEIRYWNEHAIAGRDSAEARLESSQMGRSLALWLLALPAPPGLDQAARALLAQLRPISLVCAHAAAAAALELAVPNGLHALGWSLIESQSAAAVKLIPLGQDEGQHLLRRLATGLPLAVATALERDPAAAQTFAPMWSVLSAQHETQYSRLFRS